MGLTPLRIQQESMLSDADIAARSAAGLGVVKLEDRSVLISKVKDAGKSDWR